MMFVVVTIKNLRWVLDGGSSEQFLAESLSTRRLLPLVNRPCGVWNPEEKIKNSFCYAFIIVVSLVVTMLHI
jgi:hypothetical protein